MKKPRACASCWRSKCGAGPGWVTDTERVESTSPSVGRWREWHIHKHVHKTKAMVRREARLTTWTTRALLKLWWKCCVADDGDVARYMGLDYVATE